MIFKRSEGSKAGSRAASAKAGLPIVSHHRSSTIPEYMLMLSDIAVHRVILLVMTIIVVLIMMTMVSVVPRVPQTLQ